ncbi:hypothetical protein K466DRAFT_652511 [Polyporus arcularius HHB13444]|uniref:Mid2 domain-containing protein n=1 Tax=Polyporus arcularius HHB13444 TaxID=1314778 RepID=A0A5C3PHA9_9APHY|nr:hypothetical protein K466DRAFT_652511 [Polyporus arcularius HHB13444]
MSIPLHLPPRTHSPALRPQPSRRQGDTPQDSNASYSRLTQSYASIWDNDCGGQSDQVACFTHAIHKYQDPEDYTTLSDPNLPFLATIQSFIASGSARTDADTGTTALPSPSAQPSPSPTDTASSSTATSGITSPKSTSTPDSSSTTTTTSSHTGAIIGGVIAGVVLIALAVLAFLFYRRRTRKSCAAPSAEFMHMARGGSSSPILSAKHVEGIITPPSSGHGGDRVPLARQSSIESDDRPPAFTPGSFSDPVYEKVQASAAMREAYEARDMEGGYKD